MSKKAYELFHDVNIDDLKSIYHKDYSETAEKDIEKLKVLVVVNSAFLTSCEESGGHILYDSFQQTRIVIAEMYKLYEEDNDE